MASTFVRNLLTEQRKRMVGTLMTYVEQNIYSRLSPAEQQELRKRVLSASSQYHDMCLDLLKASVDDGTVANEEAVRALACIQRDVKRLLPG